MLPMVGDFLVVSDTSGKSVLKLWLARIALVFLAILCIPIVILAQEFIARIWPATSNWGLAVAGVLGLAALGTVMTLWEKATKRWGYDLASRHKMYTGMILPLGFLLKSPKRNASSDFAVVQHGLGVEDGRFVVGYRGHGSADSAVGTMVVEEYIPFDNLRHIAIQVNSDDDIQNNALGGAVFDGAAGALSRRKVETKAIGSALTLFVEREDEKIEQYSFGIPADISGAQIQHLATAVNAATPAHHEVADGGNGGIVKGVLDASETCQTIAEVMQTGDLSKILPSDGIGLGGVVGFVGRLSSAYQLTNAKADLAAALLVAAFRQHAPDVPITRH
jgi:hypothetical protein